MKTTTRKDYFPRIWRTLFRLSAIAILFVVMTFAALNDLLIHAFLGFAALTVLMYMTIKQAHARANYLKKKRTGQLSNYSMGEDYMNVFDSKQQDEL